MRRARGTGLGAPKGTPADIVDKLNKEINAALADPKIKARLVDFGGTVLTVWSCRFREVFIADGNREVGQGGEVRGPQAGVIQAGRSIFPVLRMFPCTRR